MALNGTAIVLNRVIEELRSSSDIYATPSVLKTYFQNASESLQNTFLGAISQYRPGVPIPAHASQITSDIRNLLWPFRKKITYNYNSTTQLYEPDLAAIIEGGLQVTKYEDWKRDDISITFPFDMSLSEFEESEINFPTDAQPYGEFDEDNNIRVMPAHVPTETVVTAWVDLGEAQIQVAYVVGSKRLINDDPNVTTPTKWGQRAWACLQYLVLQQFGVGSSQPALLRDATQLKPDSI